MTKKQFDMLASEFPECKESSPEFWDMLYALADDSEVTDLVMLPTGCSVDCEDIFGIIAPIY